MPLSHRRPSALRTVLALGALAALAVGPATAAPAEAASDYEQVVDITFPTDTRATYSDDYHQPRGGGSRYHRATDLLGERGWDVYAAVGGTITWMPDSPHYSAGYAIFIDGDDGRSYAYVHLDGYAPGMAEGVEVARGERIGSLGATGNAGTPHLHFEIHDDTVTDPYGGNHLNPYPSLLAAEEHAITPASGVATSAVDRIGGEERVDTAARLSAEAFPQGADVAVLASAGSYPDAIVAGPLAATLGGPVLTTYGDALHERAREELERLGVRRLVLVDGTEALERQVTEDLEDAGLAPEGITTVTAESPAELAAEVARRVWEHTGEPDALVALGTHPEPSRAWPDALAAGAYGAVRQQPVLLTDPDALPEATAAALEDVGTATIVGGPEAVSESLADDVAARAGTVRRLSGTNRYATAAELAGDLLDLGLTSPSRLWAATGREFADALTAATAVAGAGEVFVLVEGDASRGDAPLDDWLEARAEEFPAGRVIGGPEAVSERARARLAERIAGTSSTFVGGR